MDKNKEALDALTKTGSLLFLFATIQWSVMMLLALYIGSSWWLVLILMVLAMASAAVSWSFEQTHNQGKDDE